MWQVTDQHTASLPDEMQWFGLDGGLGALDGGGISE